MALVYQLASRLLMSLGAALLACSLALVPANPLFGDDGSGGAASRKPLVCNAGCPTNFNACVTEGVGICGIKGPDAACPHNAGCDTCGCGWDVNTGKCDCF